MAITNIRIAPCYNNEVSNESEWYYGIKIRDDDDPSALWVTWETEQYKPDGINYAHTNFVVETRWRGIKKGSVDNYGNFTSAPISTTITRANAFLKQKGSGAVWYCDLSNVLQSTPDPFRGSDWSYEQRVYDEIEIEFTVKAKYNLEAYNWDSEFSPTSTQSLWVGYFPKYDITGIAAGDQNTLISYSAPGWTRVDDRYEITRFTDSQGRSLLNRLWSQSSNSVGEIGYIQVPNIAFTRPLVVGETVSFTVRWNAKYKPAGLTISEDSYTGTVGGTAEAEAIEVSVTDYDGSAVVTIPEGTYDEYVVTIEGDHWSFDDITVEASSGETQALIAYPPLGVTYTIAVRGKKTLSGQGSSYDAFSTVYTQTDYIDPVGCYWIDPIDPHTGLSDGLPTFRLMGNKKWNVHSSTEMELRKFSGRQHPSALYGYGSTREIDIEGDIPPVSVRFESSIAELYALLNAHVCVIRNDKGERYIAALTKIAYTQSYDSALIHVTINATEVVL